jgi:hypothetical protein
MTIQAEYLENRQSKTLYQELFLAVYETAGINIKSLRKANFSVDLDTLSEDVTIEIMERYKKGWYAQKNLGAVVYQACRKRLFDPRYLEKLDLTYRPELPQKGETPAAPFELQAELTAIGKKSTYFPRIIKRALIAPSYFSLLKYIAQRRSLGWIRENIDDIQRIWYIQCGGAIN